MNSASNVLGQVSADQINGTPLAAVNFIGSLNGDVTGPQGATVLSAAGTAGTLPFARVTTRIQRRVTCAAQPSCPSPRAAASVTNAAAALAAFGGASLNGNNILAATILSMAPPPSLRRSPSRPGDRPTVECKVSRLISRHQMWRIRCPSWLTILTLTLALQGCSPTASYVSNRIAVMAAVGMPKGFLIQLDDGWMSLNPRTPGQAIQWNSANFPNGIAPLAAYAHSFGFEFLICYFIRCGDLPAGCSGIGRMTKPWDSGRICVVGS